MDVNPIGEGAGAVKTLSTLEVVNLELRRSSEPENAEPAGDDPFSNTEGVQPRRSATTLLPRMTTKHGALMEPLGGKRWQPVANPNGPKTAETSANRCRGLQPVASGLGW